MALVKVVWIYLWFFLSASISLNSVVASANNDTGNKRLPPTCQAPTSWTRPFLVALVADPQIGWNQDGYNSERLFQEASTHLKRLQPDLILVAGDLIQTPGREHQYQIVKSILNDMEIPYFVISGNHDVKQNLDSLNEFVNWWNLSYYWYTLRHYNTLFVMMESTILRARDDQDADSEVRQLAWEELEWLKKTLHQASRDSAVDHVIPILHHPLAIRRLDEGDRKQNMPQRVRQDLITIFESYSNHISMVLAGHFHDSARVRDQTSGIDYITYPSTGVILGNRPREPSGFALLEIDGTTLQEAYYGYGDMPKSRPESDNAGFVVTYPSGAQLVLDSTVCIEWTSSSMANKVRLEYSVSNDDNDNDDAWQVIAESVPNEGAFSWKVPSDTSTLASSHLLKVRISSVYNTSVFGISSEPNRLVSVDDVAAATGGVGKDATLPATTSPMMINVWP